MASIQNFGNHRRTRRTRQSGKKVSGRPASFGEAGRAALISSDTITRCRRHDSSTVIARATTIALQRFNQLRRFEIARQKGDTGETAARNCGASVPTLWRYAQRFAQGGLPALAPQTARCGRKSMADGAGLTSELIGQVQSLALALRSATRAWKAFAALPECPPKLARKIRRAKNIPPSLRELVRLRRQKMNVLDCGGRLLIDVNGGAK